MALFRLQMKAKNSLPTPLSKIMSLKSEINTYTKRLIQQSLQDSNQWHFQLGKHKCQNLFSWQDWIPRFLQTGALHWRHIFAKRLELAGWRLHCKSFSRKICLLPKHPQILLSRWLWVCLKRKKDRNSNNLESVHLKCVFCHYESIRFQKMVIGNCNNFWRIINSVTNSTFLISKETVEKITWN